MDPLHQEYLAYYRARLDRVSRDPRFARTAVAERALHDAIAQAPTLDAFRAVEGKLSLDAAIARVLDVEELRATHWESLGEVVRASPYRDVLAALARERPADVSALTALVTSIHQKASARITADEELRERLWSRLALLEQQELFERAVVPPEWQAERAERRARLNAEMIEQWQRDDHALAKFVPGWRPAWDELGAARHRRGIPLADDLFAERIARLRRTLEGGR